MGGRGRGRGRGSNRNFLQQELGFGGRGEQLVTQKQPPPLYPDVDDVLARVSPFPSGEKYEYQLAMMQEFRRVAQKSLMFPPYEEKKHDIERYTDRLRQQDMADTWEPDYSRLPEELGPAARKKRKKAKAAQLAPASKRLPAKRSALDSETVVAEEEVEVLKKKAVLKTAEAAEEEEQAEEGQEDGGEEEEEDDEGELEEDAFDEDAIDEDEEGDYGHSYFDNGEGYDDDGDDSEEAL